MSNIVDFGLARIERDVRQLNAMLEDIHRMQLRLIWMLARAGAPLSEDIEAQTERRRVMARVKLTAAMYIGSTRLHAGQTMADSTANALAGDFVWTGLNSATWIPAMTPLDGAANTMKAGSQYASVAAGTSCDGVSSVDG